MGWASGSSLFSRVIEAVEKSVPNEATKIQLYQDLIEAFEDRDCDTLDECLGTSDTFDDLWEAMYPSDNYEDMLDD